MMIWVLRVVALLTVLFGTLLLRAEPSREIVVWHAYRGAEEAALREAVHRFNAAMPQWRITLLAIPYDAFTTKLTNAIPRGNGPDAFIAAHERIGAWSAGGLIDPLPADAARWAEGVFLPTTAAAVRANGTLWALPLTFKSLVLFYRRDLIATPPRTTAELLDAARRFSNPAAHRYGLAFEAASAYYAAPFLFGFGGGFCLDESHPNPCLDHPANRAALDYIARLVNQDHLVPDEATAAIVTQLFNDGNALFVINGPWFTGEITPGVPYGVALLPTLSETGQPLRPLLTVEGYFIARHNRTNRDGALAFGRFLADAEGARIRATIGNQPPALHAAYNDPAIAQNPLLATFRRQAEQAIPMSTQPAMQMLWEPLAGAIRTVLRGVADPATALAEAQRQFTIFSRPLPPAQNPVWFVLALLILAAAGVGYLIHYSRRTGLVAMVRRTPLPYLYLLPATLSLFILVFVPFAVGTAIAFFAHRAGEWHFVGFTNFISILSAADFPITDPLNFYFTLLVTIVWTLVNVLLHVSIGLLLAMLLRNEWLKLRGIYRMLLIVPWAVPNYITALIWKGMFNRQFGAVNSLLTLLGLEPISWFSSFWTAFAANVATNTWLGFPFMMVTALGALQAIPRELEDAAAVDGAGPLDRFRHVILPLLKPALLPAVILGSVWTFNMFNIIYLVSGGEPDGATDILISEAYKWAFQRQEQYGYAAAYATIIFLILLFFSRLTDRRTEGTT